MEKMIFNLHLFNYYITFLNLVASVGYILGCCFRLRRYCNDLTLLHMYILTYVVGSDCIRTFSTSPFFLVLFGLEHIGISVGFLFFSPPHPLHFPPQSPHR